MKVDYISFTSFTARKINTTTLNTLKTEKKYKESMYKNIQKFMADKMDYDSYIDSFKKDVKNISYNNLNEAEKQYVNDIFMTFDSEAEFPDFQSKYLKAVMNEFTKNNPAYNKLKQNSETN